MTEAANKPPPLSILDLVPKGWGLRFADEDELVFYGQAFVSALASYWRDIEHQQETARQRRAEMLEYVDLAARNPHALAQRYEDPSFPRVEIRRDSEQPEPLDADSLNREAGATTFNVCGWCRFNSGVNRYNYAITTACSFESEAMQKRLIPAEAIVRYRSLKERSNAEATEERRRLDGEHPGIRENADQTVCTKDAGRMIRRFYTPCLFKSASQETLRAIYDALVAEDRETLSQASAERVSGLLIRLARRAETKPLLPARRAHDYFRAGNEVVCYIGQVPRRTNRKAFVRGQVIEDAKSHEGYVAVSCDEKICDEGPFLEGYGYRSDVPRPDVMHPWEFDYLCANPAFARLWLTVGAEPFSYGHNLEAFLEALAQHTW